MIDWDEIRLKYEAGQGYAYISKGLGGHPTRQAIHQKSQAEGWEKQLVEVDGQLLPAIDLPHHLIEGLKPEQQAVIREVSRGATQSQACGLIGIDKSAVSRWKKSDAKFTTALDAAKAVKAVARRGRVEEASFNDWKAAQWLLERDPDSRGEYAPQVQAGQRIGNQYNILAGIDLGIVRD